MQVAGIFSGQIFEQPPTWSAWSVKCNWNWFSVIKIISSDHISTGGNARRLPSAFDKTKINQRNRGKFKLNFEKKKYFLFICSSNKSEDNFCTASFASSKAVAECQEQTASKSLVTLNHQSPFWLSTVAAVLVQVNFKCHSVALSRCDSFFSHGRWMSKKFLPYDPSRWNVMIL